MLRYLLVLKQKKRTRVTILPFTQEVIRTLTYSILLIYQYFIFFSLSKLYGFIREKEYYYFLALLSDFSFLCHKTNGQNKDKISPKVKSA